MGRSDPVLTVINEMRIPDHRPHLQFLSWESNDPLFFCYCLVQELYLFVYSFYDLQLSCCALFSQKSYIGLVLTASCSLSISLLMLGFLYNDEEKML